MNAELLMPFLIMLLLCAAAWKRLPVYDLFVSGAGSGIRTAVQVMPNLAAMLCAVSLMQASGLMEALCTLCTPALKWLGLPSEIAPLILIRPVSGSGALAVLKDIMERCGADSRAGLIAGTVMGSSETIFYTVCVYMSAAGEQKTRYAIPCALVGALAGTWAAGMLF